MNTPQAVREQMEEASQNRSFVGLQAGDGDGGQYAEQSSDRRPNLCDMTSERDTLSEALLADPDVGVSWRPADWRKWVPVDCVPAPLVQTALIRKRDLYELAAGVRDGGDDAAVAGLVIAVQAWGSGIAGQGGDGRGPSRAASGLGLGKRSPNDRLVPARLEAVRQAVALSATDVAAAWRSLKRGSGHLPGWDEPFFTKLMHAAGYGQSGRPWPLILDGRVRSALSSIGRTPHGYGLADYKAYIQLADQWSDQWGVSPAQVEYALFSHAGRMPTTSQAHA